MIGVDVEDWPQSTWNDALPITDRAERNTQRVLDILAERGVKATMFVLGKLAERFPHLVRRMVDEGHEVASHGYGHVPVFMQQPDEFRADVRRAKHLLEDISGQGVIGCRAPDFSITSKTLWALEILVEEGYGYDASIYPIEHGRYGIPGWSPFPEIVELPSGATIVELPAATVTVNGRHWPVAGGGYHRLLPWPLIRWAIDWNARQGRPFISYCHPYEFDPRELVDIDLNIPLKTRLHQGLGRKGFGRKFERMIGHGSTALARDLAMSQTLPRRHMTR